MKDDDVETSLSIQAAENQKYSRLLGALAEQNAETTRKLREQVVQGWLQGDDLILAKEQALEAALGDIAKHTGDTDADLEARRVLYREQADQETLAALRKRVAAEVEITDQFHAQTLEIEDRANAREIEGSYKLYADEKAQRDKNLQDYKAALDKEQKETSDYDQLQAARKKLSLDLDARNDAAKKERIEGLAKLQEKAALETQQIEMQAAIAIAPPWERADMEIYASAAQRIREINDLKQRGLIFDTDVAARTSAVWQESAGKVLDSWTSTFEELFSGGWSNYIQNLAHKFMARIAAELTLSSGLSEVLGPILGLPSGVPGMTNAGFGTTFGGGTSSLAALLGMGATGGGSTTAGASSMIGLGLTPFSGAGAIGPGGMLGGAGNTGSYNVNAVNQLLGIPTLTGVPALSGAGSLAGGGGSGLLSIAGLQSMLPLAGLFLGGKLGGTAGTIGGGLAGLMAYLGLKYIGLQGAASWGASSSAMWGGAAGGLLAGAAGGLLGFGIGQQYGTIPGTLGGAGSGALLGLMFGGPVGAIIGGILGLLGGIFGGMFGGSARTKAARQFADEQKAAADQIEAQFKSFQLDYPTALADLEQIKSNAWEQLRKLKDEGKKEYGRDLEPYVNKIEGELKGYEDERERRSTLAFAPPQFAGGGYTGEGAYGGWGLPPGAAGIVHPREYVFDEPTTARIGRGALDRMNAGASVGGDVHIWNINTLDPRNFATWLKQGGGDVLATYVRGRRLEGRSF